MLLTRRNITLGIQMILGLMLLGTGISKAFTANEFLSSFEAYKMLSSAVAPYAALSVILAELFLGASLLVSLWVRWTSALSGILFLVFTIAIGSAWQRGLQIDCGCFLGIPEPVGPGAVFRDLIFLLMSVWVWWETRNSVGITEESRAAA